MQFAVKLIALYLLNKQSELVATARTHVGNSVDLVENPEGRIFRRPRYGLKYNIYISF